MKTVDSEIGGANGLAAQVVAVHAKNIGVTKPNEWEADNIAFTYMADAGYNVGALAAVWQTVIESSSDGSKSDILSDILNPSTHPKDTDRRNNYAKNSLNTVTAKLLSMPTAVKLKSMAKPL